METQGGRGGQKKWGGERDKVGGDWDREVELLVVDNFHPFAGADENHRHKTASSFCFAEKMEVAARLRFVQSRVGGGVRMVRARSRSRAQTQVPWCGAGCCLRFFRPELFSLKSSGLCCDVSMSALAMAIPGNTGHTRKGVKHLDKQSSHICAHPSHY